MSNECALIHDLTHALNRHSFPFDESQIPRNGVYVLFQKGEHGHGQDRIVSIGTHTGEGRLRSRLTQHFPTENKDRSIFRKNIGRAILNQTNDPFLADWEIDLTSKKAKEKYLPSIDRKYQQEIESQVSCYIQTNFSFCVFEVRDKRLKIKSRLIATVSWCEQCKPSHNWLGNSSPKEKIAQSGLWLIQQLYKTPFDVSGIAHL